MFPSRKILCAVVAGVVITGTTTIAVALDCGWPMKLEQWELELESVTVDGVAQEIDPGFADLSIVLQQEPNEEAVIFQYDLMKDDRTQRRTARFQIEAIPSHLFDAIAEQGGAQ